MQNHMSLVKDVRGCMTRFDLLTPEIVASQSQDGLTYEELKHTLSECGMDINKVVFDGSRGFQNAFYADFEQGHYCWIPFQKAGLKAIIRTMDQQFHSPSFGMARKNHEWESFYMMDVPLPMQIYDFERRYKDIEQDRVFSVWSSIHTHIDYSNGMWDQEVLNYVFSHAPKTDLPETDKDGKVTIYRGMGEKSQPAEEAISWSISVRFIGSIQLQDDDMLKSLWNIRQKYNFAHEPQMREWFEKMYISAISRTTYKRLETRGYLNLICARLARESSNVEEPEEELQIEREMMESMENMKYIHRRAVASHNKMDPRVQALVDYIALHPEANLSREEMCRMCDVSESTLRRLFKAYMGKSIYEFTKETKILYASHLLMTTNVPISEIGYQLGYESASYFTKIFKEVFGISPQEYRKYSREA